MATCVVAYKAKIVKSWTKICFRITVFRKIPIFGSHFHSPLQSKLKPRASVDKKCHRYCQASNVELPITRSFFNINPPKSVVYAKIRFWKEQFKYGNYVFLLDVSFQLDNFGVIKPEHKEFLAQPVLIFGKFIALAKVLRSVGFWCLSMFCPCAFVAI